MKTTGTEYSTQIRIYTAMLNLFLTKAPKTYNGEKAVSSINVAG
jgi:hypothetical protein